MLGKLFSLIVLQSLIFSLPASYSSPLSTRAAIVDLGYAKYQGSFNSSTNTTRFLGIQYAAPPVGDLRWAAPHAPPSIAGVQLATEQPNECYQAPMGNAAINPFRNDSTWKRSVTTSEDCLFLNVYVPGDQVSPVSSGGLPVIVWIHGGGYVGGAASMYNGADLIVDSNHGVIAVLIQYRLGLFGFLSGEAIKQGGALNAGLLDQNYALQWVQSHIATFGGDPNKVTIWGESAGAGSVIQHLVAHGGKTQPPLFRAALTSSTFLPSQYNYNDSIPESLYSEVVSGTGCGSSSDTLSCLRNADVNVLEELNYNINLAGFYETSVFVPVVDGTFIIERPTVTMSKGNLNGEVLLAITNANEGTEFVNQSTTLNVSEYVLQLFPDLQNWQASLATPLYEDLGTNVEQANLATGEAFLICPTYYLLEAFNGTVWKGEFAVPPALHAFDLAYYFTSFGPSYNNPDFITAFSNGFMAVAMSMDPNARYNAGDITPTWNTWKSGYPEMVFNKTEAGVPDIYATSTDSALLDRCQYWHSVAAWTAQ